MMLLDISALAEERQEWAGGGEGEGGGREREREM
jgi:hypothetical protein